MNLSMAGNLVAVVMVGVAVWLGMQWRPSPHNDYTVMVAIGLAFSGGLLTAMASQMTVRVKREEAPEAQGEREVLSETTRPPSRSGVSSS